MSDAGTWFVVHDIRVDEQMVLVGATDSRHWAWEREDGASGSDAKTLVSVSLRGDGSGWATSESAQIFCSRSDPLRGAALAIIAPLFEIAWQIKDAELSDAQAVAAFHGYEIR